MRAIEVRSFGGPEVLVERPVPDPVAGPGQVLVEVVAADVLFVDTFIRSGVAADFFPVRPPYVPGNGVGGTVVAFGDGVDGRWLGAEVVAHTGGPGGVGGYAEVAAVDVMSCVTAPGVDLLDATAVLHDGGTAGRLIELTGAGSGDRVLVLGAGGGMGILLVQMLAARGARVVGAARGAAKLDAIVRAGATAAVDYGTTDWGLAVLDANGGIRPDVVLDGVGGDLGSKALELVVDGGRFSAHGSSSGSFAAITADAADRSIRIIGIGDLRLADEERTRLVSALLGEVKAGTVRPLIGQRYPLRDASSAHLAIERREALGKTLLIPEG